MMKSLAVLTTLAALSLLAACEKKAGPPPTPPPMEVTVVTIKAESRAVTTELPGRLDPVRTAEVRARATGILLKRFFEEGSEVKEGDVLFQIDPAPYEAAYASAQATLARAQATLKQAEVKTGRYKDLVQKKAIAQQDFDDQEAVLQQSQADVKAQQAALETANLNLGYAAVTAPISGRIGRALVTEGAYVTTSDATPLALIQQLDPIYFDFTQSSTDMLKLRRQLDAGKLTSVAAGAAKVTLLLDDGSTYKESGKLLFSEVTVDQTTGMVTLRAEFANPDRLLLPGMFARVRVEQAVDEKAITVPQRAVSRGAAGDATVMLVGADHKVAPTVIKTSDAIGDRWVVTSGLKDGDRVIVEGLQKARPGAAVKPVEATPSPSPAGQ